MKNYEDKYGFGNKVDELSRNYEDKYGFGNKVDELSRHYEDKYGFGDKVDALWRQKQEQKEIASKVMNTQEYKHLAEEISVKEKEVVKKGLSVEEKDVCQNELFDLYNQKAKMLNYVDIRSLFGLKEDTILSPKNLKDNMTIDVAQLQNKTCLKRDDALSFAIDDNGNVGRKVNCQNLVDADFDRDGKLDSIEIDSYVKLMNGRYPDAIEDFDQKEKIRDELGIKFADKGEQIPSSYKYALFKGTQNYEQAKDDCYYVDFNETNFLKGNRFYEFMKDPKTGDVSKESVEKFNQRYNLDDLDDLKQLKEDLSSEKSLGVCIIEDELKQLKKDPSSGKSFGDFFIEKNNPDVPKVGGNGNNLSEPDDQQEGEDIIGKNNPDVPKVGGNGNDLSEPDDQQKGEESSNNPIEADDNSKNNILENNENPAPTVGDEGGKNNSAAENGIPQKGGQEIA